jgi:polyhydroxyalkanoate synthesis regulator phasin
MRLTDVIELLPIYHQYAFQSAVELCDTIIHSHFDNGMDIPRSNEFYALLTLAVVLSYELDLPISKKKAVEFAKGVFSYDITRFNESQIRDLLPLIQEEESTLKYVVSTMLDRGEMSIEEMRSVTLEESFVKDYKKRFGQIEEQAVIVRQLNVTTIRVNFSGAEVNGEYELHRVGDKPDRVMSRLYVKYTEEGGGAVVYANDLFGRIWHLSTSTNTHDLTATPEACTVLYRWESDVGSIVPPRRGWSAVVSGGFPVPELYFTFDGGVQYLL